MKTKNKVKKVEKYNKYSLIKAFDEWVSKIKHRERLEITISDRIFTLERVPKDFTFTYKIKTSLPTKKSGKSKK